MDKEEVAIIRGGWEDHNGNFYQETPNDTGISSLNIFFKEETENNLYNKIQNNEYSKLSNKNDKVKR